MRARIPVAAAATAGALLATAAPATAASTTADGGKPARTVAWSAGHGGATAAGDRWIEQSGNLVLSGTLSHTGEGCYSVWTRFVNDFAPGPLTKLAEVCGPGTVAITARHAYRLTTTGRLAVCRGTENVQDCGPWHTITSWPVNRD
ncbi:hypothetical protein [Streptomyces sp. CB03238]|uniref:hypothetical protein n=1 Tax=Streptomyces sp. CB03238 TaxID=1907777 RepID=UPI000A0F8A34|nr:hypothetical protein [Streptomyces sp. CB03238]ORT59398.1 hypothetical protein BKD26_15570 [Streptomyces sp. CB03238]